MTNGPRNIESSALEILLDLAGFTATSFWEDGPASYLSERAESAGLEVSVDEWGNVLAMKTGTNPDAPGIAFVAHMDHPGYEVVRQDGDQITLKTLGGLGIAAGRAGTTIVVVAESGEQVRATITGAEAVEGEASILREAAGWLASETVYARFDREVNLGKLPRPAVPDLPDFELEDGLIKMRAADDLAGCAAIVAALESVVDAPVAGTVYGLFTRAEEVGLVGAQLAAKNRLFPTHTVVVSVETSSVLPGAEIGSGVVIRTGDRAASFDYEAEAYLGAAAQRVKQANPEFKFQRQLMSAGGCEASAFKAFGYKVTGTAFPLGSWHNRGDDGVESEYISKDDFIGGALLISAAAKLAGTSPSGLLARLANVPVEHSERLATNRSQRE